MTTGSAMMAHKEKDGTMTYIEYGGRINEEIKREATAPEQKIEEMHSIALPKDYVKYNEIIGLPISRITNKPAPMTWYQIMYHLDIQQYHHELINKNRKGAFSEAAIRSISLNCFDRYIGHDVIMAAGNEFDVIRKIMVRFDELFKDRRHPEDGDRKYAFKDMSGNRWNHDEVITRFTKGTQLEIEFFNDTRLYGFAVSKSAQRQSFRGPDDTVCIFFTETAHTGMNDDGPVFTALEPNLANRDDGDLIYESTPNGQRGTYYDYVNTWKEKYGLLVNKPFPTKIKESKQEVKKRNEVFKDTGWNYREVPYLWALKAQVVSEAFIEFQRKNPRIDFPQEFECKFTTSKSAAFDELTEDNYLPPDYPKLGIKEIIEKTL